MSTLRGGGTKNMATTNITVNQTNINVIGGYGGGYLYRPFYLLPVYGTIIGM